MKLVIVSGGNPPRFSAHLNHAEYARIHRLGYIHDTKPRQGLQTPHFHKIAAIQDALGSADWVLWMDDDAFFTDFWQDMTRFIENLPDEVFLVACKSPINPKGGWTFLNSGVFFVKNCPDGRHLLSEAFSVPKQEVNAAWLPDVYGIQTKGEQAHIIHILHRDAMLSRVCLHDWRAFNARPYHWPHNTAAEFYPVVHFAGTEREREAAIRNFAVRFGRDESLREPAEG